MKALDFSLGDLPDHLFEQGAPILNQLDPDLFDELPCPETSVGFHKRMFSLGQDTLEPNNDQIIYLFRTKPSDQT